MIVDDSKAMRVVLRRAVSECGFDECVEAQDGRAALDALRGGAHPQMIFADWNMPEMDGLQLLRAIRSDSKYDDIAVVMVTSEATIESIQTALDAGADEYVMKPFTADALRDKISLVLAART